MKLRIAIVIAMLLAGIYFYGDLPDPMPTHWNFAGEPDSWGAKIWAAWLIPGLALLLTVLFPIISKIDPRHKNYEKFKKTWNGIQTAIIAFFGYLYGVMLYILVTQADGELMGRFILAGIGLLFVILGNYMGKVRWNYFVGLKTPWALDDPEVWQKSQRFAGWFFVFGGLVFMFEAWWYQWLEWVFGITVASMLILPTVYSYLVSRQKKDGSNLPSDH